MNGSFTGSQQQAIAARGNVLVVAGAGTGKTSTLVQRCIALLEEGCSLENILMVTFTEAAAAEMRGRIREALQGRVDALQNGAVEPERLDHFQKQIALLDTALISTLHSFCMQMVREHFFELGIDPDVTVLDEQQTRPLIQQILDQLFEHHYAGEKEVDRAVQRLVRVQGRGSDDYIRGLILKLHRYSQSLAAPGQWLEGQRTMFSQSEPVQWREWFISGFLEWRALWLPVLGRFAGNSAVALAAKALANIPSATQTSDAARALQSIKAADDDEKNWPRGSKKNVRAQLEDFFDEAAFLLSVSPIGAADPLLEDWDVIRHDMFALLELVGEFGGEFSRVKREMGGVDFSDLEQFALRVLRRPASKPEATSLALSPAALQWQRRLEHVFVDEYQDINAAQDSILSAVSRDGPESNRFLVGDVKQSIYRFRLADPTIFRQYERLWSGGKFSRRISLAENFRSRPGILDFVNPFIGALMRDQIGGVAYEPLIFGNPENRDGPVTTEMEPPRVELHLIARAEPENNEATGDNAGPSEVADLLVTEREARLAGLRLRKLKEDGHRVWDKEQGCLRPVEWRDMAVLLRSPASRVEAFAKEFAALGIPLEAARAGFFESPEVSDLVSLLKLLDNPLQDVPLLAVLHSPLVGMSLAELAEIRACENPSARSKYFWRAAQQFLIERGSVKGGRGNIQHPTSHAQQPMERPDDSNAFPVSHGIQSAWQKLERFFTQMNRWRELVRQSSLSHCLETALAETHYEILLRAGPRGEQQLTNVRRLLELAREYDPYQRQGLFRFLRFIRAQEERPMELEPSTTARDAVQLTSIHRSKGLEFPVVALAGMGWKFNDRDLSESILLDEQFGLCPRIAPPESDGRYPSLPHWLARRKQQRELLGEELRLLYVAMTRARDTLVLTGTSSRKNAGQWSTGEPRCLTDQEILSGRCYLDWLKLWLPQVTRTEDWPNEKEGRSRLICWNVYDEDDARLALPGNNGNAATVEADAPRSMEEAELARVRNRIEWVYPFESATKQRAKTSVTELRRGQQDEESQAAAFVPNTAFSLPNRRQRNLNAAEIGVAHHRFLQRISLEHDLSEPGLQAEARRLRQGGWISEDEFLVLDLESAAAFWKSNLGQDIVANAGMVRRELQFTAGLNAFDLAASGLIPSAGLPEDEVVVIQGVVDLAVILEKEIWIVDFKTDSVMELELPAKVKTYEPQLQLYALALSRIYNRPVTQCALYFLATRRLTSIEL
jgi:ATP-dependent helicase/nuclease subunit A